jgi:hypothetical protein
MCLLGAINVGTEDVETPESWRAAFGARWNTCRLAALSMH